ncbi:putative bifunctional diguanylate cyclase/phosphodiesterase [Planococcus sp. YIM B11945]|uniref:putative bifunctional diguanylate cyclase/phosphodiesterase n=1 Tax=Planococcus sp. YIM B11945 TaxID=3435410 RepID=UPI003D7D135F
MLRTGRFPIFLVAITIGLFAAWNIAFKENEWMAFIGIDVFRILVGLLSFVWLSQAFQKRQAKQGPFWLLLSLGVLFFIGTSAWRIYLQLTQDLLDPSEAVYAIWLLSNGSFLSALLYKVKELRATAVKKSYFFNMWMFMIAAISISFHFIIQPVLVDPDSSLIISLVTSIYPLVDLGIMYAITVLYYQSQQSKQKNLMLYVILSQFMLIVSDWAYSYLFLQDSAGRGVVLELFWMISVLLIGLAGFYSHKNMNEDPPSIKNLFEEKSFIFPYAAILVLLAIVISDYQLRLNALSLGLLVSFIMILGRQLLIIRTNEKLMDEFKYLAYHDSLTGLNNRISFQKEIEKAIAGAKDQNMALVLIDLDRFKVINDTLGHYVGDQVLIKAAARLKKASPPSSALFRLGGDEFVIILPDSKEEDCLQLADAIVRSFQESLAINGYDINVTPSIGISIYPENGKTSENLFKNADAAMYLSKENGKNRYSFYNTELHKSMTRKMIIETELRKAIAKDEFSLFYQPKVDMQTQEMIGMEALLRWHHPELGSVSPAEFIPIAEETGQIVPIGSWVLRTACLQNKTWQDKGLAPLCVSVNVSALQFQQEDFLKTVSLALEESQLDASFLELEITESIMKNIKESIEITECLRAMRVKISIDDFGTGYSSLHILPKLPIHTIKIDKSFIDDIEQKDHQLMMKAIIDLGLTLKLNVIAEGIENEGQMNILLENKCRFGQGYLFSKPVPAEAFEYLLPLKKAPISN